MIQKNNFNKLFSILILIIIWTFALEINGQETKNTEHNADKNLKGSTRINPSTLAMEFSLSFGGYSGRAGNSTPIVLSYSSKVWHQKTLPLITRGRSINEPLYKTEYITAYNQLPTFGKRTIAGWSSSLQMPALILESEFYNQNGEMHPLSAPPPENFQTNNTTSCNGLYSTWGGYFFSSSCGGMAYAGGYECCPPNGFCQVFVTEDFCVFGGDGGNEFPTPNPNPNPNPIPTPTPEILHAVPRIRIHMPDGSSQEFRKTDKQIDCIESPTECFSQDGTYLSVNGTGMSLDISTDSNENTSRTLNLPGGGKYIFTDDNPTTNFYHQARYYIDPNGNKSAYNDATGVWTDTLGREILNPLPGQLRSATPPPNQTQEVTLPGMSESYKMTWKNLRNAGCINGTEPECQDTVLEDTNQELKFAGNDTCQSVLNKNPVSGNALFTDNSSDHIENYPDSINGYRTIARSRFCAAIPPINPDSGGQLNEVKKFNPVVLAEVELPTGEKYRFRYNEYGEITKITYPTGSSERFDYGIVHTTSGGEATNRGVKDRWVYNENGTEIKHWNYHAQGGVVTTIAPDDSKTVQIFFPQDEQGGFGFTDPLSGFPKETQSFDTIGRMISRSFTKYKVEPSRTINGIAGNQEATRDPRPEKTISIMIEPGSGMALATQSETIYDTHAEYKHFAHLNPKETKTTHYVSLTEAVATDESKTIVDFESLFITPQYASISRNDYEYNQNYLSRGITSLPIRTKVLNPNDPAEVLAQTETIYDSTYPGASSLQVSYGIVGSMTCPTSTGSVNCWESPNTNYLGRPTTSRLWDKDNNGTWIESHTQYDIFGNAVKAMDAIQNEVQTNYTSTYKYAYPASVVTSAPDPTGIHGTNLTSQASSTYDLTTGLPLTATDDFGQTTKTEYDSFLRPVRTFGLNYTAPESQTVYGVPVNGQLPSNQRFVKVRKQIDATNWDEAITWFDGLGRTYKTEATDSQGNIIVETLYDNFGRVRATSQPYRTGDAKLWSVPRYDELNRAVESFAAVTDSEIANPPTSKSTGVTSFGISNVSGLIGTYTVTTDASGRKGRSVTNSLGQLARVDEPTAMGGAIDADLGTLENPHQPTYYSYDIKGNMVKAQQGKTGDASIQYRYFKYDSLGRLIRVKQPEQEVNTNLNLADSFNTSGQWTAAYAYDGIGNLIKTTDATGVNIINEYDKAGRVTRRCYSKANLWLPSATNCGGITGGNISDTTPEVKYYYDGKELAQEQAPHNYAKGKLTVVRSSISETRYKLFDNFGRLTEMEQKTPFGIELVNDAPAQVSKYVYDFGGRLVKEIYPSGREVKNEFESDGDLMRVFGKANANATEKTYVNSFSYTASGGISRVRLGNGKWETAKFNDRQQITELGLGNSATDASAWKVNYEYGEIENNGTLSTSKNTGNIARQTLSFAGLANPLVQTYRYDSVYRLKEAKETSNSNPEPNWSQNYDYDRYGNRTVFNENIGGIENNQTPAINQLTNRFTSTNFTYDKNGNITKDISRFSQARDFVFNAENKQIEIKDASNNVIGKYYYDGEGKRVKKVTDTETTVFVYSGGKLVAEYSTQLSQTPTTSYTTTDHLGTPRVITDALGQVKARRDFMPFGEELTINVGGRSTNLKYGGAADDVRQKFTGYQMDTETELDFAEARMYENRYARFTAVDPLLASGKSANPQTFNRYVYVSNNPILRVDRNGEVWTEYFRDGKWHPIWFDNFKDFQTAAEMDRSLRVVSNFLYQTGSEGSWASLDRFSNNYEVISEAQVISGIVATPCLTCLRMAGYTKYSGIYGAGGLFTALLNLQSESFQAIGSVVGSKTVQSILRDPALNATVGGMSSGPRFVGSFRAIKPNRVVIGNDAELARVARWTPSENGLFQVINHGDEYVGGVVTDKTGKAIRALTTEEKLKIMRENGYTGGPVRLFECHSGCNGSAQDLANRINNIVIAPTDVFTVDILRRQRIENGGYWKFFEPNKTQ